MAVPPTRAHIRTLFLRILGVIFVIAFVSILVQVDVLIGSRGLLPAQAYLDALRGSARFIDVPTVFWLDCSDRALHAVAIAGAGISLGLILNIAPRYCLLVLWMLYLSFVNVGQDFFSFQWDNLLLESAFFSLFITPGGVRPRHPPPPHPIAVFLMLWLVFRLHVESGAAKLLTGDPTWRDLTAMVSYYETAPLPTWLGWYAHQMPLWAHQGCALFTFFVELLLPLFMWAPSPVRVIVFLFMIAMQVSIVLTANYGFFNYLSMAVCLFVLDDRHLQWLAARFGWGLPPAPARPRQAWRTALLGVTAAVLVPASIVPFLRFFPSTEGLEPRLMPVRRVLSSIRSINPYHLFASMTLVRREVVIEGSDDGETWQTYEFRYKPGDPDRAPPFVAPHQPRLDFQLWFLLLGGPPRARYFNTLLERLLIEPTAVAPLFARDPFPLTPPRALRLAFYRYTFTDIATRRASGAWWHRERLGYSTSIDAAALRR